MDYFVSVDNEESNANANALSITGRVNGVDVAVVIKLSDVKGTVAEQKKIKQRALITAFINRTATPASGPGEKVSL